MNEILATKRKENRMTLEDYLRKNNAKMYEQNFNAIEMDARPGFLILYDHENKDEINESELDKIAFQARRFVKKYNKTPNGWRWVFDSWPTFSYSIASIKKDRKLLFSHTEDCMLVLNAHVLEHLSDDELEEVFELSKSEKEKGK